MGFSVGKLTIDLTDGNWAIKVGSECGYYGVPRVGIFSRRGFSGDKFFFVENLPTAYARTKRLFDLISSYSFDPSAELTLILKVSELRQNRNRNLMSEFSLLFSQHCPHNRVGVFFHRAIQRFFNEQPLCFGSLAPRLE